MSVKISGLHPRYELAQRKRVLVELYPRLLQLAELAKKYGIGFHLDQEESARFELTLEMLERLCKEPSLRGWDGIGISLQAYQKRRGATILLSSHNMTEVEQLCDFVVIMSSGRIVAMGRPVELAERFQCKNLDEVFIHLARVA